MRLIDYRHDHGQHYTATVEDADGGWYVVVDLWSELGPCARRVTYCATCGASGCRHVRAVERHVFGEEVGPWARG